MENFYKQAVSIFFSVKLTFKREKSVFWKASFCKRRTDYSFCVQDFATGKNSSFNHCHNKEFRVFSWECYFIKTIEYFFPVFALPDI